MRVRVIIIILSLLFGTTSMTSAQELRFQNISPEDGLSNGRHWAQQCILKDNFGVVWVSTIDGLNRWDGYDVEVFKQNIFDTTSIHSNFVTALSQDVSGDIYIGTADKGISKYDYASGTFTDLGLGKLMSVTPLVNHVLCDQKGNVWIGTAYDGVYRYNIEKDTFISVPIFGKANASGRSLGTSNSKILRDGTLVIAGNHGLHFYNEEQDTFRFLSTGEQGLRALEEAPDGKIWSGNHRWEGILVIDPVTGQLDTIAVEGTTMGVYNIRQDHQGNMWFSKSNIPNERLIKYDFKDETMSYYPHDPSNDQSFLKAVAVEMIIDSSGHMWYMSSSKGAGHTKIENSYFEQIWNRPVHNILFVNDSILILPGEAYVDELNLNSRAHQPFYDYGNATARMPSLIDAEKNLWTYDRENQHYDIVHIESKKHKTLKAPPALALVEDAGRIWTSNSLNYIDKEKMQIVSINELLKKKGSDTINPVVTYEVSVLQDHKVILATASNGFYLYNPSDTSLIHNDGLAFQEGNLSSSSITNFYESEFSNTVIIATAENLNIWDRETDHYTYVNESDGLQGRVLSMIEDEDKAIWVLTTKGIHKVIGTEVVARYGKSYDLQGMADRIDPIMVRDKDGYIYFNTSKAVHRFHPKILEDMPPPKDVLIQDLFLQRNKQKPATSSVLKKDLLMKPTIKLDYKDRDVGFGFASPFEKNRDVEYHYKLIGYDDTWVNNGLSRQLHFTNLNNGDYTLLIKGRSSEGQWTLNTSEIGFTILPPWYKRIWAYLIFACLVFGSLYGLFKYRIYQLTKYHKLRTKISADLHDDVGTLLTSLSMQSDILAIDAAPEKQSQFDNFGALSREAMDRMRDTVWAIDSRKDNLISLIDRMADYISDMYEGSQMNINFHYDKSNIKTALAPDVRQNVYLIFKEAINNAMKYSDGDTIDIELQTNRKRVFLSIKDNGSAKNIKTSGLGLSNMKMRAKKIKGKLEIITDNGFEVRLTVDD